MTEEQKMQFMMALAQSGANISQINFGDGTQNFYLSKDGSVTPKEDNAEVVDAEIIVSETETSSSTDDVTNRDAIPSDCMEAVKKVIAPTFNLPNGMVMNSAAQIVKAAKLIDLSSNSQVAMLMAIGMEVNAVRSSCSCPDFVRALIGMRLIAYTDNKAIDTMADGMTKKLNGYTKGYKKYPPLPGNHQRWNTNDQSIGTRLYDAMKSQA